MKKTQLLTLLFTLGLAMVANAITVSEIHQLNDDAKVTLVGNLIKYLGDEKYLFKDATGEIVVDIDDDLVKNKSILNKKVELQGEVDKSERSAKTEIEVDRIIIQ